MIEMRVAGLALDPTTEMPIVLLRGASGGELLPIWVGVAEASAIASVLESIPVARPLTHDLLRTLLDELGATVERVEITELREGTFYARLVLRHGERALSVDARPSDAVAVALRVAAPILVAEDVLARARPVELVDEPRGDGTVRAEGPPGAAPPDTDEDREPSGPGVHGDDDRVHAIDRLDEMAPDRFGKYKM